MAIQLQQIPARSYQHAVGDKRRPTRYAVLVDGEKVGEVFSRSRDSWRVNGRRIRAGFRGFTRGWQAEDIRGNWIGSHRILFDTRAEAVEELLQAVGRAGDGERGSLVRH